MKLRKILSLALAILIWGIAYKSMTTTKIIHNIAVRVVHLPSGTTLNDMKANGVLNKRVTLTLTGDETLLNELTGKDLEVVIDAQDTPDQWVAKVTRKNLICLNQQIDFSKAIHRVTPMDLILKKSPLLSEKIPISLTAPVGEVPKGYQFLDVFPYQVYVTVTGPEETVQRLKAKGLTLTFNMNDISNRDLDALSTKKGGEEIQYPVPTSWKKIQIPTISELPLEIDDPQAAGLRIDFLRQELIPIDAAIPISIFFPTKTSNTLNPETYSLATNDLIVKKNGIKVLALPLYAHGVDRLFVDTVKDMLQIVIVAAPKSERETLLWNTQIAYPRELENRYVATALSAICLEEGDLSPRLYEQTLRNRFRNYMTRFRLHTKEKKLALAIELQANTISVSLK